MLLECHQGSTAPSQLSSNAFFIVLQKVYTVSGTRPTSCATVLFLQLKQMFQQAAKKKTKKTRNLTSFAK
jgi:hypothetical protein